MLLEIKDLRVSYTSNKQVEVVRGVSLDIKKGECVAIVGESGCGKTTVGLSVTKLISKERGNILSGKILFNGQDILALDDEGLRNIRGRKISYVFQEAFSSLNPVFTIYEQLRETVPKRKDTDDYIKNLFMDVGLSEIVGKKNIYPHELSGGMQQRVMIAMAIASSPDILVLDEPTTALDVTVQRKMLMLIESLREKEGISILFISHDLRVVFGMADRINVMYAGKIVESGIKEDIVSSPKHPYTKALIDSIPSIEHRKNKFNVIKGRSPLFSELPKGCKFYPRCSYKIDECTKQEPDLKDIGHAHLVRCIRDKEIF